LSWAFRLATFLRILAESLILASRLSVDCLSILS